MKLLGFQFPSISFEHPDFLWCLVGLPLLAWLSWHSNRRRRLALIAFGTPSGINAEGGPRRNPRRWSYTVHTMGMIFLIVAVAGPRWGRTIEPGIIYGRDVIAVLDLSRSMLAEDVTLNGKVAARWQVARAELKALADTAQQRGGHRLALLVFAARAKVIVPLTADYDHFRRKLDELDGMYPPPEIAPGAIAPPSGTRIGAAVELASSLVDPRFPRATDILLVSDGDDPGGDSEWQLAVTAALRAGTVIDTAGVGTEEGALIPLGVDSILEVDNVPVTTQLRPEPLQAIAQQTGGNWLPGPIPALSDFFHRHIEPRDARELDSDSLPRPTPRQRWFFGIALVFLVSSLWFDLRRQPVRSRLHHASMDNPDRTDASQRATVVAR